MPKLGNLQQIREIIRQQMVDNLTAQSGGSDKQLYNALEVVNQSTMWRLVNWMHHVLLPKIEASRGLDSDEYKNFVEVEHAIVWSMHILQQYERVLLARGKDKHLIAFYQTENARLEMELSKYATAEVLASNEAVNMYASQFVAKALNLITSKPENNENAEQSRP